MLALPVLVESIQMVALVPHVIESKGQRIGEGPLDACVVEGKVQVRDRRSMVSAYPGADSMV